MASSSRTVRAVLRLVVSSIDRPRRYSLAGRPRSTSALDPLHICHSAKPKLAHRGSYLSLSYSGLPTLMDFRRLRNGHYRPRITLRPDHRSRP